MSGNKGGRHLVNDALGVHRIVKDKQEIQRMLQEGWRFGITVQSTLDDT